MIEEPRAKRSRMEQVAERSQTVNSPKPPLSPDATAVSASVRASADLSIQNGRETFLDAWSQAQLVFFGGKGGVGKTTLAVAAAMAMVRRSPSKDCQILLMSVDPAHSLSDILGRPVGAQPVAVEQSGGLWAMELDAAGLVETFKRENGESLLTLVERGSFLDRSDTEEFLDLAIPGADEVMAVVEIVRRVNEGRWDRILVDTAPTGHTLRFLGMPEEMQRWLDALDVVQEKYRYLKRRFGAGSRVSTDAAEQFLLRFHREAENARIKFAQCGGSEFVPVTIAEPMALAETERLLDDLLPLGIHPRRLIVNRWVERIDCAFCTARNHRQRSALLDSPNLLDLELLPIPAFPTEMHSGRVLLQVADALERLADQPIAFGDSLHALSPKQRTSPPSLRTKDEEKSEGLALREGTRFVFFGGKGGVGKTSLAAATGLRLATAHPDKRVVVFSTDPAHSLGDSLAVPLGPELSPAGLDNLLACEQDAATMFDRFRNRYRDSIEQFFEQLTSSGVEVQFEKESIQQLTSLSPPGADEIMFLASLMELADSGQYDLFVVDTAPTGHSLRFLGLPRLAQAWVQTLLKVMLKYGHSVGNEMLRLARNLRRFQGVLTDAAQTEFVLVTNADKMALDESERLLEHLTELRVGCHSVVCNKVMPKNACGFCRHTRDSQEEHISDFRKAHPELRISTAPLFPYPVTGQAALRDLEQVLFNSKLQKHANHTH